MPRLATPDFNAETIKLLWPGTFKKSESQRGGYLVEFFSTGHVDRSRYVMDFQGPRGFYQWDTSQDAWYYGTWVNPESLQILNYAEGDISLVTCNGVDEYKNQLAKMDGRLDDHDDQHWVRLEEVSRRYDDMQDA